MWISPDILTGNNLALVSRNLKGESYVYSGNKDYSFKEVKEGNCFNQYLQLHQAQKSSTQNHTLLVPSDGRPPLTVT